MIKPNRHKQRKAATHQKMLCAVREAVVEKGYSHVDILDITERANVSKASFYKHFANKEECVRELMQQGFDALVEQIFAGERTAPSRQEWVLNSLRQVFNWSEANREFLLIMVGGAASSRLNTFGRNYMLEIIERVMAEFGADQESTRYSPQINAQITTGVMIQVLGWWLENDTGYSADEMASLIHDVLKNGLGPLATDAAQ